MHMNTPRCFICYTPTDDPDDYGPCVRCSDERAEQEAEAQRINDWLDSIPPPPRAVAFDEGGE